MVTKSNHDYYVYNDLAGILKQRHCSISALSKNTGISRPAISQLVHDPQQNITLRNAMLIAQELSVPIFEALELRSVYAKDEEAKFTIDNLKQLNDLVSEFGISLDFEIYSWGKSVNVYTKYATHRSVYLSGNFRISGSQEPPQLTLIDFDIIKKMGKSLKIKPSKWESISLSRCNPMPERYIS